MSLTLLALFWIGDLPVLCPRGAAGQQQERTPPAKTDPKSSGTLKGCIDEQEGRYVLISADTRAVIASLQAEGFPTEGFAKHVGHKVTVRGTSIPGGTTPVFKVRSVETLSDSCAPDQQ